MPRGWYFHSDIGRFCLPGGIVRRFICLLIACVVPACGHLKERTGCPAEAPPRRPLILEIYQGPLNHLAAVRRGDCPMFPTCSEFSAQAVATHGVIAGGMMTLDRLLRCGRDELHLAPRVFAGGHLKAYDPVANNDFWWAPSKQNPPP